LKKASNYKYEPELSPRIRTIGASFSRSSQECIGSFSHSKDVPIPGRATFTSSSMQFIVLNLLLASSLSFGGFSKVSHLPDPPSIRMISKNANAPGFTTYPALGGVYLAPPWRRLMRLSPSGYAFGTTNLRQPPSRMPAILSSTSGGIRSFEYPRNQEYGLPSR